MLLISKFKDYYDHIGYQYGQDKKYVYNRELMIPDDNLSSYNFIDDKKYRELMDFDCSFYKKEYIQHYWLVICGKLFLIYKDNGCLSVVNENSEILKQVDFRNRSYDFYRNKNKFSKIKFDGVRGGFSNKLLKFNIENKCPIIVLSFSCAHPVYKCASPILGDIQGFVKLYSAQQIYQDIYYFLSNQVNGSPDIDPEIVLDNRYKILYHGFDSQSFKHRK